MLAHTRFQYHQIDDILAQNCFELRTLTLPYRKHGFLKALSTAALSPRPHQDYSTLSIAASLSSLSEIIHHSPLCSRLSYVLSKDCALSLDRYALDSRSVERIFSFCNTYRTCIESIHEVVSLKPRAPGFVEIILKQVIFYSTLAANKAGTC